MQVESGEDMSFDNESVKQEDNKSFQNEDEEESNLQEARPMAPPNTQSEGIANQFISILDESSDVEQI